MQLITVIAMNEGHPGRYRARRFFPNGAEVVLEVLDQDADPEDVKGSGSNAGHMVPDPGRIGKKSFREIKEDVHLKVLSDGITQSGLSKAAFDEAKRTAESVSAELAGAKIEVIRLKDENETLREQVKALQAKLAPAPEETPAPPEENGGKGNKGKGGK